MLYSLFRLTVFYACTIKIRHALQKVDIVAGIVQIFWALPMVKRWGKIWYYSGIAGTAILIILWVLTRAPNPITGGRAFPIDGIGVATVVFQIAYIMITVIIIAKERCGRVQMIRAKRL